MSAADFREFLRLLNRHRVKYLVVGGYAVAYHGYARYPGVVLEKSRRARQKE